MALRSAAEFYAAQRRRTLTTLLATRAEWAKLSKPADFDRISARLLALLTSAQLGAATDASNYVPAVLAEQGSAISTAVRVQPASFAGWGYSVTNPGLAQPLESLLQVVPEMAGVGGTAEQMLSGGRFLDLLAKTQVVEAGRMATAAGISAQPNTGWVRHVNPPCCQDCAVLAGKFFRHNTGFQRHHGCDCVHVPAQGKVPDGYLDSINPDQIHDLTEAQRRALADGADLSQVVNAYRRVTPSARTRMTYTGEGTTRRGYASYLRRAIDREQGRRTVETATSVGPRGAVRNYTVRRTQRRLTPEGIYAIARNDAEALLLLQKNGYIVGDIAKIARTSAAEMQRIAATLP